MVIKDLDYFVLSPQTPLKGAAFAFATGNTIARRNFANANAIGIAQGQQIFVSTATATNVYDNPNYSFSQAVGSANAYAQDPNSYATASYFGSSTFTGSRFKTTSRNLSLSISSSTSF